MTTKFIPKSLKIFIKNIFATVGREKLNKIDVMFNMIYDIYPPLIIINANVQGSISDFKKQYSISDRLNVNVSKNDFMFKFLLLYHSGKFKKTYYEYLESGLNAYNVVSKLTLKKFGNITNVGSLLDVASGHGRLERFLILEYPAERIWVSDIKESANQFQMKQFGVNSLCSTFNPKDYCPDQKFDIIFVGSLFTHLPEKLFESWLLKLYSLITEKGVLIVSTHNISLYNKKSNREFIYLSESEDTLMPEIEESIEDTNKYGTTYISHSKFINILEKNGINSSQCFRYEKALWGLQDVYVITKDGFSFDNSIDFDSYP
jgi:trans-aconitate methyltransferase